MKQEKILLIVFIISVLSGCFKLAGRLDNPTPLNQLPENNTLTDPALNAVQVKIDSATDLGNGNFLVSGHTIKLDKPTRFRIAAYRHIDNFYAVSGHPYKINSSGEFTFTTQFPQEVDRLTVELIASTVDPDDEKHCNGGSCQGVPDSNKKISSQIPFRLNGIDTIATDSIFKVE